MSSLQTTRRHLIGLAAGVACAPWWAPSVRAQAGAPSAAEAFVAMTRRPLVLAAGDAQASTVHKLPLGRRADGSAATGDLYLPAAAPAAGLRHPVALLLHGGVPDALPIRPRTWQVYRDWGHLLARHGVAALVFEHRLGAAPHRLDDAMQDVAQALAALRDAVATVPIDTGRVAALAFSSGGLLVPELLRQHAALGIGRFALLYPATGLPARVGQSPDEAAHAARMALQPALGVAARDGVPLLVVRAGADTVPGLLPHLDAALAAALAANARLHVHNLPRAPHGFDNAPPAADAADAEAARDAIAATVAFAGGRLPA